MRPAPRPLSPPGSLDLALRALAASAAERLSRATGLKHRAWVLPELDGSLTFRIEAGGRGLIVAWLESTGRGHPELPGGFAIRRRDEGIDDRRILQGLGELLLEDEAAWLRPQDILERCPTAGAIAKALSARWFPPGRSGWYTWRVEGIHASPNPIRLTFAADARQVIIRLVTADSSQERERASQEPFFNRLSVSAFLELDERKAAEREAPEHQVERVVALALSRVIPRAVRQPSADAGRRLDPRRPEAFFTAEGPALGPVLRLTPDLVWRQFMSDTEFTHFLMRNENSTGKVFHVSHSDLTCCYMQPFVQAALDSVYRFPWPVHLARRVKLVMTDLKDHEVIRTGGEEKLRDLLQDVHAQGGGERLVVLDHTCLPQLLGQDIAAIARDFRQESGAPLVHVAPSAAEMSSEEFFFQSYRSLMQYAGPARRTLRPSLNLVGFHLGRDVEELKAILADLGVRVLAQILPNLDLGQVRRFRGAWRQVWRACDTMQPVLEKVFRPTGVPPLRAQVPFGVERTERWFAAIARALGAGPAWRAHLGARRPALDSEREAWRRRLAGKRLGFIVALGQLPRVWDERRNLGLSPLAFAREFGLELKAWVHEPDGAPPRRERILRATRLSLERAGFGGSALAPGFFSSPAELRAILAGGHADLFFSELQSDPRLLEAGVGSFCLADFEMGFDGAFRTCRRLLGLMTTPFFARYRAALAGGGA
jgi:hypothetical protein